MTTAKDNGRASEIGLIIEDAEAKILRLSKQCVLQEWTKNKYITEVDKVIAEAELVIGDSMIRIRTALHNYASEAVKMQREILVLETAMFAMAWVAMTVRQDVREFDRLNNEIGEDVKRSPAFVKLVNERVNDGFANYAVPNESEYQDYYRRVKQLTEALVTFDAKDNYETNVNLRNVAEMTVRYERQTHMIDTLKEQGEDLVWIEPHANCSERCEKYQGRLYSLKGRKGQINGIPFLPLTFATDNPADRYTTKAGVTYQNGCLTGFNCRHKLIPYREGNKPAEIPASVIEKTRSAEERQRSMEREIRKYKRIAIQAEGTSVARKAKKTAVELNKRYKEFSRKEGLAFYPERTKLFAEL